MYSLRMSPQRSGPKQWWTPKDWGEEQALRVAREVHRLRGSRSAQWLAGRTGDLGYGLSRSLIADLENGRRRYVTTAEVTILAAALNTAPIALLYPAPYDEEIEALPGARMPKAVAVEEFSGIIDPLADTHDAGYAQNLIGLIRARQIRELERAHRNLAAQVFSNVPLPGKEVMQTELNRLDKLLDEMRSGHGG